ncbi:MAG: methyltransferase domain-containing protein [Propionibacteriales bacterium]|nr:methyltransferase domain-containing protein [Propionibacteriales bacterium]
MADHRTAIGALRSTAWRDAVLATPRLVFVPRFFRPECDSAEATPVSSADPGWLDAVYSDEPLVTQFDEDPAATGGNPTSSSTAPDLMLRMLEVLDIDDGHNVLEIGTGTGYNAALLCHRLGDTLVTSIDVDESVTSAARDRLAHLGLFPAVITGDGAAGHPDNGPYDQIIATCAVRRIPSA